MSVLAGGILRVIYYSFSHRVFASEPLSVYIYQLPARLATHLEVAWLETGHSLSCADYKEFHIQNKITLTQLQSMPQEDVVSCLPIFGETPLGEQEAEHIWGALIKMRNGASGVTDSDLRHLGWVLRAVPVDDIANFTLSEPDTIAALGRFRNLTEAQLQALAERILEDWANKDAEQYTNYDLSAMQHILCGFNRSFIEAIHSDSYKDAAVSLVYLQGCPIEPLQALATLAQSPDAFGPLPKWSGSQLKFVGCVINGLVDQEIALIPAAAFEAVTPDIIPCFSSETLKSMTSSQLGQLTPSVVTTLTPLQSSKLSKQQREALLAVYESINVKAAAHQCLVNVLDIYIFSIFIAMN